MIRQPQSRRGVVILVVLSLLVLFVLLVVTFAILAGQYRRAAQATARQEWLGVDAAKDLDKAFYQLLRDTGTFGSAIRGHSLLRDIYGETGFHGNIFSANTLNGTGDQFWSVVVQDAGLRATSTPATQPSDYSLIKLAEQYSGCVLTVTTGEAQGISTRIVRYEYAFGPPATGTFYVVALKRRDGRTVSPSALANAGFVVNGRPFQGTGIVDDSALTPNYAWQNPTNAGGSNEPYDAADYQNMFLAGVPIHSGLRGPDQMWGKANVDDDGDGIRDNVTERQWPGSDDPPIAAGADGKWGKANVDDDGDGNTDNKSEAGWPDSDDFNPANAVPPMYKKLPGPDGKWGNANVDDDGDGTIDNLTEAGWPFSDDIIKLADAVPTSSEILSGPDGKWGKANVDDDGDGTIDNFTEAGWRGSDDIIPLLPSAGYLVGPDGNWGIASIDDDGDTMIDNISEAGWPGSDDVPISCYVDGSVPSFHRPALAHYWKTQGSYASIERRVSLRPVEPSFDGSNPAYNPVWGPWDIDNDGDGTPDSIWVDLGLPVQTSKDGRQYRPLFAILCRDMDGRLNVNVHGRKADLLALTTPAQVLLAGAITTHLLPRGQGYGPPEIAFDRLFTSPQLLINTRYGGTTTPGMSGTDLMAQVRFFDRPLNTGFGGVFRSPADLQGELRMGLDPQGHPVYEQYSYGPSDSPYETDVTSDRPGGQNDDAPYTPVELERILRQHDFDASQLPSRLADVLNASGLRDLNGDGVVNLTDAAIARRMVTTDSYDVPVPGLGHLPTILASGLQANMPASIQSLPIGQQVTWLNNQLRVMLAPDLLRGLRLDINRPLGDGEDNNGNDAIDDPLEAGNSSDQLWTNITPTFSGIQFNHANQTPFSASTNAFARQILARHLYVAARLLNVGTTPKEVAQWAINVVDFRDPDAIMTPFEFDPTPLDGWDVDGVVNGYLGMTSADDVADNIVWGCERPELLISEVLAFHDRRTEDLDRETPPNGKLAAQEVDGTQDFDQRLRPVGSCFIELYNPWNDTGTQNTPPGELYSGSAGVQLNQSAGGYPVWRILVVNAKRKKADGTEEDNPDFSKSPDDWMGSGAAISTGIPGERGIYFANPSSLPADDDHGKRRFFPSANQIVVPPGSYAIAGSPGILGDGVTTVGRVTNAVDSDQALQFAQTENLPTVTNQTHRIVLTANTVDVYHGAAVASSNPATVAIIDSSDLVGANVPGQKLGMSLSLSEPVDGYPYYDVTNTPGPGGVIWKPTGANNEGSYQRQDSTMGAIDQPLDSEFGYAEVATQDGTIRNFCILHLQRLADPTQPWNETGNPYRTIDSSLADLTVFNGLNAPHAEDAYSITTSDVYWCVERGENEERKNKDYKARAENSNQDLPSELRRTLWSPVADKDSDRVQNPATPDPVTGHHFEFQLTRSLGKENHWYTNAGAMPFPWFTWNDRPYVSQYELLNVPHRSSYELLRNFALRERPQDVMKFSNSYFEYIREIVLAPRQPTQLAPGPEKSPKTMPELWPYTDNGSGAQAIFGHTGNRLRSDAEPFFQLLEYVHVPSRFSGTETIFNPMDFQSGTGTEFFSPPFNRLSAYREPGRVNINTISHPSVWDSILNGFSGPSFDELDMSRRGNSSQVVSPTWFLNPFRAPGSRHLVPPIVKSLEPTNLAGSPDFKDIDVTLLRSFEWLKEMPDPTFTISPPDQAYLYVHKSKPLLQSEAYADAVDCRRNSYFRYQNLNRLGNLLTTRSNVYAIWITVGYFEVEPTTADASHPDGLRVAMELGSDTGEVRRHRAFYMIDRTIPVAFQPGENHNVDECVLLRRFIE